MRTFHKVAVVAAALGSVGAFGAGTAYAHGEPGHDLDVSQGTECRSHDMNIDVLGAVGLLNGPLGNALNGEGAPGSQPSHLGSDFRCDNSAF
ncbi:hypothetical protein ACH4YO_16720 [Streptomyces noursei]|uniref:Small secreted domain n=2 Tax=Streptomyces TaxID=1883 RepID=A0A9X8QYY6_9ACTN|nr:MULTISPECIES: hypothetical protein [Streptomyces]ANZ15197.1 membrane protein [Streptomyces noursei ATCC 11455]AJC54690.1 hypothetical protein GZL_02096 [Streptomyces sp. 769]MCZ0992510.1 hypothetical protein [Streptomyces noursei]MCZ1019133.1 hypothetical protein [Streptomyces noursei]PNE38027.1 hypothetical protein AOB60_28060 [Streptomyces noursei]